MYKVLSKFYLLLCLIKYSKCDYDYNEVLRSSLLFYEAQRSGKLPDNNRIKWRADSMLDDKGDNGEDLTGGYFDAGDHVKFGFPMAFTTTVMSWGVIDYKISFIRAKQLNNARDAIKWATDYFIKCHTKEEEFYGQVGNGSVDHSFWGRPEDWPKDKPRPAFKVTKLKPGSDLVGETSAALAAASIVFRSVDRKYSDKCLMHSKQLYRFANKHRGIYSDSITDASKFYRSSGYGDELGWAAVWLFRATNDSFYKKEFDKHWVEFKLNEMPKEFSWDCKVAGLQVLMAKLTNNSQYKSSAEKFCNWVLNEAPKSPKKMVYLDKWGTLRHASNVAFICLQAADLGINSRLYRDFADQQINYALGDTGRSFVVGIGVNPPKRVHHRSSSCPDRPKVCDNNTYTNPGPNPHIITGALVGGPDLNDTYVDSREDYVHNEVACDYNAGFQSAVAAISSIKSCAIHITLFKELYISLFILMGLSSIGL